MVANAASAADHWHDLGQGAKGADLKEPDCNEEGCKGFVNLHIGTLDPHCLRTDIQGNYLGPSSLGWFILIDRRFFQVFLALTFVAVCSDAGFLLLPQEC